MFQRIEKAVSVMADSGAEIVYVYSDFRGFGQILAQDYQFSKADFFDDLIAIFKKYELTVLVPTFSYTTNGVFLVESTPTNLGALNKFVMRHPESIRSEHPLFSFSALGPSTSILNKVSKQAFGEDSVFSRLLNCKSYFLHIGRPVQAGTTIIHFIEQKYSAWYRYEKVFPTQVFYDSQFIGDGYSAYLRKLDHPGQTFETKFMKGADHLFRNGVMLESGLNENFMNISYGAVAEVYDCLSNEYSADKNFFI
jgi:aminoglycoside 3-N-acetyltransferase